MLSIKIIIPKKYDRNVAYKEKLSLKCKQRKSAYIEYTQHVYCTVTFLSALHVKTIVSAVKDQRMACRVDLVLVNTETCMDRKNQTRFTYSYTQG